MARKAATLEPTQPAPGADTPEAGAHPPTALACPAPPVLEMKLYYVRMGSCPRVSIEAETPEAATALYRERFLLYRLDLETDIVEAN